MSCVHTSMQIQTHGYTHLNIQYIYTYTMYVNTHILTVHPYRHTHAHTDMFLYVHICRHIYTSTYRLTHIHTYTEKHMHTYIRNAHIESQGSRVTRALLSQSHGLKGRWNTCATNTHICCQPGDSRTKGRWAILTHRRGSGRDWLRTSRIIRHRKTQ